MEPDETLPPLSEAQLEIMDVVWDRGESTVGDVWRALSARRKVAPNTVQTLVTRLVEKGWLTHRAEGRAFRYRAARPRAATLQDMVRRLVRTAFHGSPEGLVMTLLEGETLDREQADRLRALIERAEHERAGNEPTEV